MGPGHGNREASANVGATSPAGRVSAAPAVSDGRYLPRREPDERSVRRRAARCSADPGQAGRRNAPLRRQGPKLPPARADAEKDRNDHDRGTPYAHRASASSSSVWERQPASSFLQSAAIPRAARGPWVPGRARPFLRTTRPTPRWTPLRSPHDLRLGLRRLRLGLSLVRLRFELVGLVVRGCRVLLGRRGVLLHLRRRLLCLLEILLGGGQVLVGRVELFRELVVDRFPRHQQTCARVYPAGVRTYRVQLAAPVG